MHTLALIFLFYYLAVLAVFCLYGLHRWWLVFDLLRTGGRSRAARGPRPEAGGLPAVTVQLPMFNEGPVAERVIRAACALDYPGDHLQIQVLDDSADGSAEATRRLCARLRAEGHDVEHRHRRDRTGFKAGALAEGLSHARGELIALFDADFVPPPSFLRDTVPPFADPELGMLQARWTHLNRDASILTAVQAMALDAHFLVEHAARARRGRWFNFNGTAGVWRRRAIDEAGGWEHDTLTEDTDLSYRAQLAGWRFDLRTDVTCPAELPPTVDAFISQQHRWNAGLAQNAIKLLPRICRSAAPLRTRLDALMHLTAPVPYVAMLVLTLITVPALLVGLPLSGVDVRLAVGFGLLCLVLGTGGAAAYLLAAAWVQRRPIIPALARLPLVMAVGVGISPTATRGVVQAVFGRSLPFVRTPKFGAAEASAADPARPRRAVPAGSFETTLGLVQVAAIVLTLTGHVSFVGLPFLLLFATGYLGVGLPLLRQSLRRTRPSAAARLA